MIWFSSIIASCLGVAIKFDGVAKVARVEFFKIAGVFVVVCHWECQGVTLFQFIRTLNWMRDRGVRGCVSLSGGTIAL